MESYSEVGHAFNPLALRYEELVESDPLHAYMRKRSVAWLEEAFRPGSRVLEIGCGVGHEAAHLGRLGVRVVATDVSPCMVEATLARIRREGLEQVVDVKECAAGTLDRVFPGETFDGAFASFGALNCEPDLDCVIRQVADRIRPGGDFLLSVVSRPSLSETALSSMRFHFRRAFRRMAAEIPVNLYGLGTVRAHAYSEGEIVRAFAPAFRIERLEGWLIALPPPSAAAAWGRMRPVHPPLEAIESRIRSVWPFRGWGDHLHVWAKRMPG